MRQGAGEVRLARGANARAQRSGMVHAVLFDRAVNLIAVKRQRSIDEARHARVGHRVAVGSAHGQHVAFRLDVGALEGVEQVDRRHRELLHGFQLLGKLQILFGRDLVGEAAHHRGDDGAPAHFRAKLVAQSLQRQRLLEKLRHLVSQGKHAFVAQKVRRGEHEQVRSVVLQVRPIHQKVAQSARAVGHLDAKDALNGQKIGDHMARRADAANARGDVGNLFEAPSAHHALEQARRLHDVHLNGFDLSPVDDHVHVAVALDAGDMVDLNRGFRHAIILTKPAAGRGRFG